MKPHLDQDLSAGLLSSALAAGLIAALTALAFTEFNPPTAVEAPALQQPLESPPAS